LVNYLKPSSLFRINSDGIVASSCGPEGVCFIRGSRHVERWRDPEQLSEGRSHRSGRVLVAQEATHAAVVPRFVPADRCGQVDAKVRQGAATLLHELANLLQPPVGEDDPLGALFWFETHSQHVRRPTPGLVRTVLTCALCTQYTRSVKSLVQQIRRADRDAAILLEQIRKARAERKWSVQRLLDESGLTIERSSLHRKLKGDVTAAPEEVEALARALGVLPKRRGRVA
jgi:hypothetical protein